MGWTPEKRAAAAARMKARHADPEFKAKRLAAARRARGCVDVPPHLKKYAAKLRANGIRGDDFRKAIEAMAEINRQEGR